MAMRLQQTLQLLREQLLDVGEAMKAMAIRHTRTVMVARTNSVDASATTWGLHVCSYLAEINRHLIRLQQLYPRAVTGLFGGAVGNLASVGEQGMETRERLMRALGLNVPCGINNASQDAVVEVVQFLPLFTARYVVWPTMSKQWDARRLLKCLRAKVVEGRARCRTKLIRAPVT